MKTINIKGNKYVDQDLFNYISRIWLNYDVIIASDSNVYFLMNTSVNRLITDYCEKDIRRVIKKEKADYVVLKKFNIQNFPQYYDGVNLTSDDTKEVVYAVYNLFSEDKDCIEQILWFIENSPDVKWVNQDKLNESLNNGFIIDKNNYNTIKELVDSNNHENHKLAVNMLVQSDLSKNWEWIVYLFWNKPNSIINHDQKQIIQNYINSLGLSHTWSNIFTKIDSALGVVKNLEVQSRLEDIIRGKFQEKIQEYLGSLGSSKFVLDDFKIHYNES